MNAMESICFQADADLNQAIVTGVLRREPRISLQTAIEANLEGIPDAQVLALSAKQQRVLIAAPLET
ncbi:MAG: hypothetical protein AAFN40_15695 [Cyanobacteria bacterium J06560_6]